MTILKDPDKPISALTVSELESLITEIIRRALYEAFQEYSPSNGEALPKAFLDTFGAWDDDRSSDEIVTEIYESRTVSKADLSL